VTVRDRDGAESVLRARAVISAVGQLNRPKLPGIAGRETFAGPSFHSAQWDHSVSIAGKRVAVVGAGASAFQLVPAIVDDVAHLTVFQRTAPWMFPNPGYHDAVGPGAQWAIRHLPFYGRWYRFLVFWPGCDGALEASRIDPDWPHQERSISERNEFVRDWFLGWMHEQCGDDEALKAKVTPDYPPTGRRTLQDNGSWLGALRRDHVDLVTAEIDHIDEHGIVDADGNRHDVDVIVYATGFRANDFLWPVDVVGPEGTVLAEQWGDEPRAYLGITTVGFPNLFFMYGPSTNLAHGGSLIFHSECQIRYIMGCLELLAAGARTIEPKPDVHDAYVERTQAEIAQLVWSHPSVHSYFKNADGKIYQVSPWPLLKYWEWTKAPNPDDFVVR
jgi:4-hydroxyacetophenone monooxygenase